MITYRGESKVIKELCRVVNSAGASSLEVIDGELYAVYDGYKDQLKPPHPRQRERSS